MNTAFAPWPLRLCVKSSFVFLKRTLMILMIFTHAKTQKVEEKSKQVCLWIHVLVRAKTQSTLNFLFAFHLATRLKSSSKTIFESRACCFAARTMSNVPSS